MVIVILKFSDNRDQAGQYMAGHKEWLQQGFNEGVFLLAGSLQPGLGGIILTHGINHEALQARLNNDPFVAENVVCVEVLDIAPAKVDQRLSFLLE